MKPIGEYIDRAVSDKRVETGKQKLVENQALLDALETRYGVDRHIIVAIWGVESNYGTQPGDKNVIRSLATLICSGTKAKFARPQLVSALKILQRGDISFEAMNGSWAGAMGHTQFIPTTYTAYAVDHDGDGKRDIWGNMPDALASTASYLKVSNWRPGETWGYEVTLPKGFNPQARQREHAQVAWRVAEGRHRAGERRSLSAADRQGLAVRAGRNAMGRPSSCSTISARSSATTWRSPMRSPSAISSDRLQGRGPFVHPWPTDETHLSLEQRTELQQLLIAQGLMAGEPDGVIGPATLEAVKTYQRSKGLGVDGYPSLTLLKMLRSEARSRPAGAAGCSRAAAERRSRGCGQARRPARQAEAACRRSAGRESGGGLTAVRQE